MKKLLFLCYCIITLLCGNTVFGDEPAERRAQFINEGFGFEYLDDETANMDLFIARHGKPIKIIEEVGKAEWDVMIDKKYITLEYGSISVLFKKWRDIKTNKYRTLLIVIDSKENAVYLYGIKHGLPLTELEKIVGKITFGDDNTYTWLFHNENRAGISFDEKDKISHIEWFYNVQ